MRTTTNITVVRYFNVFPEICTSVSTSAYT
jgi:hypothetical protein